MTPRFSATIGSVPSAERSASNSAAPGPLTHWPVAAVGAEPGISQYASNPRKWSSRMRSTSASVARIRSIHHA
jgi:hypothetical protein